MRDEIAVLGKELADILISEGFELVSMKSGKYADIYYFVDTCEIEAAIDRLVE